MRAAATAAATVTTTTTAAPASVEEAFFIFEGIAAGRRGGAGRRDNHNAAPAPAALPNSRVALRRLHDHRMVMELTMDGESDLDVAGLIRQLTGSRRRILLVVDVSGSMHPYRAALIEIAKAVVQAVRDANIPVGMAYIIPYDSYVGVVIDAAEEGAMAACDRIFSGGGTCYAGALRAVAERISPDQNSDVIFMSDGQCGDLPEAQRVMTEFVVPRLTPDSHVQTVFFGTAPPGGASAAFVRGTSYSWGGERVPTPYEQIGGFNYNVRGTDCYSTVDKLKETLENIVQSLADEWQLSICLDGGVTIRAALFSTENKATAIAPLTNEQVRAVELATGTVVTATITGVGKVVRADVTVVDIKEAMTPEQQAVATRMETASRVAQLERDLTEAVQGSAEARQAACLRLIANIETMKEMQKAMKVAPSDATFRLIRDASDAAHRVVAMVASNMGNPQGLEIRGLRDAFSQLGRVSRWSSTTAVGKTSRAAQRAVNTVSTALVKHRAKVVVLMTKLRELLQECIDNPEIDNPEGNFTIGTPEDPVTLEPVNRPVVIVSGPGAAMSTDDVLNGNEALTMAINAAASGRGSVKPISLETYLEGIALYRTSMTPALVGPFRSTGVSLEFAREYAPILGMNFVAGVNTIPAQSVIHIFSAIGYTYDVTDPFELPSRLSLARYWHAWAERIHRGGDGHSFERRTLAEWACARARQPAGLMLAGAQDGDGSIGNPQTAMMVVAFAAAVNPDALAFATPPAVLYGTAAAGVRAMVSHLGGDAPARLRTEMQHIATLLVHPEVYTRVEDIAASALLDRLEPHLVAVERSVGTHTLAGLDAIVHAAARVRNPNTAPTVLYWDSRVMYRVTDLLFKLASTLPKSPGPTVHGRSDSWAGVAQLSAALTALLGPAHRDNTVHRADRNGGWIRPEDMLRACEAAAAATALPERAPSHYVMRRLFDRPEHALWTVLTLLKTQGNNAQIRELVGDAPFPDNVDPDFVDRWVPDTPELASHRTSVFNAFFEEMANEALQRLAARAIRPSALCALVTLALRNNLKNMALRMIVALASESSVTARDDLRRIFLACVPAPMLANATALRAVLDVIDTAAAAAIKPHVLLFDVPRSFLTVPQVKDALIRAGVSGEVIDAMFGAPGKSSPIPNSQRFNRHVRQLAADFPAMPSNTIEVGIVPPLTGDEAADFSKTVVVEPGSVFDPSMLGAIRVVFVVDNVGIPVARRIDIRHGEVCTVHTRNPFARTGDERRWSEDWTNSVKHTRENTWLVKRNVTTKAPSAAPAAAPAAASAAAPAAAPAVSVAELETIVATVSDLLDGLGDAPVFDDEWDLA